MPVQQIRYNCKEIYEMPRYNGVFMLQTSQQGILEKVGNELFLFVYKI